MWRLNNPILKLMTIFLGIIAGIAIFTSSAIALSEPYGISSKKPLFDHRTAEYLKIQWVLEKNIADKSIVKKMTNKLTALNDKQIKLICSLCDRISSDSHSACADVAFLLLTTLIVFS